MTLEFTSSAFTPEEQRAAGSAGSSAIPVRFANTGIAGGHNVSIPYAWRLSDAGAAKSFALAIIDEAPVAHGWVHWLVADIPASMMALPEGASGTDAMPAGSIELGNSFGKTGYGGPQPPAGTGAHPYVATLYALDVEHLGLASSATRADFQRAIAGHVIAQATCTGTFGQ